MEKCLSFIKKNAFLVIASIFFVAFIIFTILVKTIDVNYLDRSNTYIGFYHLNSEFGNFVIQFGKYDFMKKFSDILLYLSFGYIGVLFVFALIELIKNKSFKKLDKKYYVLLGGYIAVVGLYFIFEIVKVNYSPDSYIDYIHENPDDLLSPIVGVESHLHASYPSTHVFVGCAFYLLNSYIALKLLKPEKSWIAPLVYIATGLICFLLVFTRSLSAKHWLTDIIASILLLICVYALFIYLFHKLIPNETIQKIEE